VVLIQSHKATRGSHVLLWSPTLSSVCKDKEKNGLLSNDGNTEQSEQDTRESEIRNSPCLQLRPLMILPVIHQSIHRPACVTRLRGRMCMQILGLLPLSVRSNQHHLGVHVALLVSWCYPRKSPYPGPIWMIKGCYLGRRHICNGEVRLSFVLHVTPRAARMLATIKC
jgi:hypothetical protein